MKRTLEPNLYVTPAKADDFMGLLDMLRLDLEQQRREHPGEPSHSFYGNRCDIADAFRERRLYMLTDLRRESAAPDNRLMAVDVLTPDLYIWTHPCTVPAFAVLDDEGAMEMLWVRADCQGKGYGRTLVEELHVNVAAAVIPTARSFWEHVGFRPTLKRNGEGNVWMTRAKDKSTR